MESFIKKPAELYSLSFEYKEKLPPGGVLSSATVSAVDTADGSDKTSTVLVSTSGAVSGTLATFRARAGTAGSSYRITLLATLTSGDILQDEILMIVDT